MGGLRSLWWRRAAEHHNAQQTRMWAEYNSRGYGEQQTTVRPRRRPRPHTGPQDPVVFGVLMAFAMASHREDDCREMYARILASVLQDASFAVTCCRGAFRGPALPYNATQHLCEALPAGTEPTSTAEGLPTAYRGSALVHRNRRRARETQ